MTAMRDPIDFIPLTPRTFHILFALSEETRNGYQIMGAVEDHSQGKVTVGPGTLYEALHRLRKRGLIEEADATAAERDGRGQRFYLCTSLGRRVLHAEAERLTADLELVRGVQLGDGGSGSL
jgi:DNA-binding PadR family transcriptional regulator